LGLAEDLTRHGIVGLDAAPFIYQFEASGSLGAAVNAAFAAVEDQSVSGASAP
jgi:hypothetical protein